MAIGRNRAFDNEEALSTAIQIFWKNGYTNTSLVDLTQGIGINKPSLYNAFGNKEELFLLALKHYVNHYSMPNFAHLLESGKPFEERMTHYLKSIVDLFTTEIKANGCFLVNSTLEMAGDGMPGSAREYIALTNQNSKQQLTAFFERELDEGSLKSLSTPYILALHLMSTMSGLAVLARDGVKAEELKKLVDHAVKTFY